MPVPYRSVAERTLRFSARDRSGQPHSIPYFLTVFRDFFVKREPIPTKTLAVFRYFNVTVGSPILITISYRTVTYRTGALRTVLRYNFYHARVPFLPKILSFSA